MENIYNKTLKKYYKYLELDLLCLQKSDELHSGCSLNKCQVKKCRMVYISAIDKFLIDISNNIFILFKFLTNNISGLE